MSNDITLAGLRMFIEVVTHGSFSEVARRHSLPVSSVSRHVSGLEQRLGQKLLVRNTRSLRLTDHGREYFKAVRDGIDLLDMASEEVRGGARSPQGTLRVNAPLAFGRRHIAPHLSTFQKQHPALQVELTLTDAYVDPVSEAADVVVRIGPMQESSLLSRKFSEQHHMVVAAPEYLQEYGRPTTPQDLQSHNCLIYKGNRGEMEWNFRKGAEQPRRQPVTGNLNSNDADSLIAAALRGQGLVLFPTWLLHEHIEQEQLLPILTDWQAASEQAYGAIHLLFPENRLRSLKVTVFMDFLAETIGRPPYWDRMLT